MHYPHKSGAAVALCLGTLASACADAPAPPTSTASAPAAWRDLPLADSLRPATPRSPIAVLGNGLIAISVPELDDGSLMAVVDTQGQLVNRFGRKGKGPGELTTPAQAFSTGERLWVYDMGALRASAWSADGQPASQIQFNGPVLPAAPTSAGLIGLRPTPEGEIELREYSQESPEGWMAIAEPGPNDFTQLVADPFREAEGEQQLALLPSLVGNDSMVVAGFPARFALYWFRRADGTLIDSVVVQGQPNRPTPDMVARYRESVSGPRPGALTGERLERTVSSYERSELPHFFRYGAMVLDGSGRLWVASARADTVTISRISPAGVEAAAQFPCPGFLGSWGMNRKLAAAGCLTDDLPGVRIITLPSD